MAESCPNFAIRLGFLIGLGLCASAPAAAREAILKLPHAQVVALNFNALAGWANDDHAAAYATFLKSCSAILQGSPRMRAARSLYVALFKVCERTKAAGQLDEAQARAFFEGNFKPVRIAPPGQTEGFFTGYYETEFVGSRVPTDEFKIPIYAAPAETIRKRKSKVFAHFDRAAIENGALKGKKLEICYVKNPVDAFFAQIQGSTRVKLNDGKLLRLNYVASNGQRYTPVGKFLIDRGYHPPTVYFPMIVKEAIMIEPTETESKATMDAFIEVMIEAAAAAETNPRALHDAPLTMPISRLDETKAAREQNVCCQW
jgi:membrane-bound lytic murein transglycosylase A